jgi:CheY-like chemotaxis protein
MKAAATLIVVVDDDIDVLNWMTIVLGEAGYRTRCCFSPDEAFRAMSDEAPALVITDLMMDSLDAGFTFARRLRDDPRFAHKPIIVITAVASQRGFNFLPRTEADLQARQVDAMFSKPGNPDELVRKVRELLALSPSASKQVTEEHND